MPNAILNMGPGTSFSVPEDQGAVPYTSPFSLPLYGGPFVTIHASLDDITSASKGQCSTVSPNETGAPFMGSSGQRAGSRSGRPSLAFPLRPGPICTLLKAAWYKCVGSAERQVQEGRGLS